MMMRMKMNQNGCWTEELVNSENRIWHFGEQEPKRHVQQECRPGVSKVGDDQERSIRSEDVKRWRRQPLRKDGERVRCTI